MGATKVLKSLNQASVVFNSPAWGWAFSFQAPLLRNQLPVWALETDSLLNFKLLVLIVRAASSEPEPSLSRAILGSGCWKTSHDALGLPLLSFARYCMSVGFEFSRFLTPFCKYFWVSNSSCHHYCKHYYDYCLRSFRIGSGWLFYHF